MTQNISWLNKLNSNPIPWLLESNPWTRYRILLDLLDYSKDHKEVITARKELINHPFVNTILTELSDWMPKAATRNNDPQIHYFKLRMLADFGLSKRDKGISAIKQKAITHVIDNHFACRGVEPSRPKKGEKYTKPNLLDDVWHISPCNSPMITYALKALGFDDAPVKKAIKALRDAWNSEIGWFCHYFFVDSQFKREQAGCPMAGLMALELFSLVPELKESIYAQNAFVPLVYHKNLGKSIYYFGRSKKFWTFKYPFVWYNGLYLVDVLSRFSFTKDSPLLSECINWIESNQDSQGRFKATSIFLPYKQWDFGQKKEPSPWITFLCCRILKRHYS